MVHRAVIEAIPAACGGRVYAVGEVRGIACLTATKMFSVFRCSGHCIMDSDPFIGFEIYRKRCRKIILRLCVSLFLSDNFVSTETIRSSGISMKCVLLYENK